MNTRMNKGSATLRRVAVAAALGAVALAVVVAPVLAKVHRRAHAPAPAHAASTAAAPTSAALSAHGASAPADLAQWCTRVTSAVAGVGGPACQSSGLVAGDGRSVKGVPLWSRDVLPAGTPRFKVLLLGGIHGDELASVALAFDWLARSHASVPARSAMPAIAWRFVPLLNPDGLLHAPSTRVNANGVDLNRNFPTADWARDARPYWVQRTKKDPRRFPGTQPLSEPESRWLLKQIDQFHPDLIVSVHAPYGLLDFDGPPPAPHRLGSLELDPVGVYPGSLGNYGGLVKQVPVMTLELKDARQVQPGELAAMWNDLRRWIDGRVAHQAAGGGAHATAVVAKATVAPRNARTQD